MVENEAKRNEATALLGNLKVGDKRNNISDIHIVKFACKSHSCVIYKFIINLIRF